jgi:hypothetical protein
MKSRRRIVTYNDAITAGIYDRRKWGAGVDLQGSNAEPLMSALGQ